MIEMRVQKYVCFMFSVCAKCIFLKARGKSEMEENIHRIHLTEESVISALYQSRDDFYRFGKHIHPAFEIYHFLSGECRMEIGSRVIQCRGGDFIMIMQNTVHSFFMEQKEPCCFYHIHFLPSLFEKLFLKNQEGYDSDLVTALVFKNNWYYKTAANEKLAALTAAIVERYAQDTPFSRAFVNAHLLELLLHVLELSGYEHTISTNGGGKSQYVQFALNYIHRNYTAKILIDDIAEALNISSRYLSKIFFSR